MPKLLLSCILSALLISCYSQDCQKLPIIFTSYSQAIKAVQSSNFKIKESANTSSSSWMTSAKYYSCDGNKGFFIYTTNRGYEYIHSGVPLRIWEGFKNADSKGKYYNSEMKNRYQINLK
jgi:hypothetical protein